MKILNKGETMEKIIEIYKDAFKAIYNLTKSEAFRAFSAIFLFVILFVAAILVPMFFTKSFLVWFVIMLCCHTIFLPIYVRCCRIADRL